MMSGLGNFVRSAVLKMAVLSTNAPLLLFTKGWKIEAEVKLRLAGTHRRAGKSLTANRFLLVHLCRSAAPF